MLRRPFGRMNRRGIGAAPGTTPPPSAPTLTAPLDGAFLFRTSGFTVSATATDLDLDRIDWVLNPGGGETVVATDAASPYSQTWTVGAGETLGAATLVARAVRGGLSTDSTPINVTIIKHPSEFGTLEAWIDPRYEITHSGDLTAVTDWNDHSANAHNGSVIDAPTYEATGWNGMPSVVLDGTNDALSMDTVAAFASGSDLPFQIVASVQMLSNAQPKGIICFGSSGSNSIFRKLESLSSDRYHFLVRDDALLQKTDTSAVSFLVLTRTRLTILFSGTTASLYKNTTLDTGIDGTGDLNVGTTTLNRFSIGCNRGASNTLFTNVRFGPVLVFSTLTDQAGAEQWLTDQGYN